ncbi:MAG: hypothetical protein OEM67_11630 [Thermoleophilia bacterium]|nr:hypothetical protein [Thermoleophilia bacterium]
MTKTRRLSAFLAVGAVGLGAVLAAPASAQETAHGANHESSAVIAQVGSVSISGISKEGTASHGATPAERRADSAKLRRAKREARRAIRRCEISPDKLTAVEQSKLLTDLKQRFDRKVDSGEWTAQKAERRLARIQKGITIRSAMEAGRWRPMLELFGADARRDLGKMLRKAKGMRSLMEQKGVSRAELRAAKRAGKIARYKAVVALCASGKEPVHEPEGQAASSVRVHLPVVY